MEPFYFLKCEHQDNRPRAIPWQTRDRNTCSVARSSCTVRAYGKNEKGESVTVELFNYQPDFFVSFRDRTVCARVVGSLIKRKDELIRLGELGSTANRPSYIKGMENVTGFSSLIVDKEHQDRNAYSSSGSEYGDTSLSFTFRVFVRCFGHVRPAIQELLDTADEGAESGRGNLSGRDIRFYQSSLEPDMLVAETLKLRPCEWTLFDPSVCEKTVLRGPYDHMRCLAAAVTPRHTYSYNFEEHIDKEALVSGRLAYDRIPFARGEEHATPPLPLLPPPVSVMSFDIECLANDVNVFPTPDLCAVIQIATVTARDALNRPPNRPPRRCLYTLRDCEEPLYERKRGGEDEGGVDECVVRCFEKERDMLAAFCADLVSADPDIVTGYYIENFDLPFLFARFQHHDLRPAFSRLGLISTCVKNVVRSGETATSSARKYSSQVTKSHFTTIHGRTVFDACVYARKEFTMRSYTLNAVAERFLGARKDDVHYTQIPSLFFSGPRGRAVLGRYCVKDAQLVIDLLFNRHAFTNMFERCKVFNTTLGFLIDRGQQVRIASMLLKWCSARAILIDDRTVAYRPSNDGAVASAAAVTADKTANRDGANENKRKPDERDRESDAEGDQASRDGGGKMKHTLYDGAVVIEPKTGLHRDPVVCLDYASLYPSIMIAHNLCYTTMITNAEHGARLATRGEAVRTPVGHYFLKAETKKGVLPSILETLISTRTAVRSRMAGLDKSSVDYTLLDGQQNALKIAANSVYGATGCQKGKLFFLQIPSSVTAYGRELITTTKQYVESVYTDREVVYGDTDSVMVRMIGWTERKPVRHLWECADAGDEMAAAVTRLIDRPPIRLQFETVYLPFLLASKKRYAAGIYKSLDHVRNVARMDGAAAASAALATAGRHVCYKGLEVVRRDNCLFVKNALQRTIDMIMDMEPPERVVEEMRERIARLLRGEVNVRDLIVSKQWSKRTKNPTPHDRLAQKMAERNPGEAPQIGDRIQYVVVAQNEREPPRKLFDRAEDPLYALENGLALDYVYYANNQLLNPLTNLLVVVMPERGGSGDHKEDIKNMLWPKVVTADGRTIERPGKRPRTAGALKRVRRNSKFDKPPPNNTKITSFITRRIVKKPPPAPLPGLADAGSGAALKDIEDICSKLAAECMICKSGEVSRTATCKNRDCTTLYERYEQKSKIRAAGLSGHVKREVVEILGF